MIADDEAVLSAQEWLVNGSKKEGRKMQQEHAKLMLRAFNGEANAALAKVTYGNADKLWASLEKAALAINKLGKTVEISINPKYIELSRQELFVQYEFKIRQHKDTQEQKEFQAKLREDEKAEKENNAILVKEERRAREIEEAIGKAKVEMQKIADSEKKTLLLKIKELEALYSQSKEKNSGDISSGN